MRGGRALGLFIGLVVSITAAPRDLDKLYKKADFKVGEKTFSAYLADDEAKRAQGLMFIEEIPADVGMLFIFEQVQPLGFWMKNTVIPLNIGFFDEGGVLIDIQEMKIAGSLMDLQPPTYQSRGPALFALEMNTGWFARHKIKTGSHLQLVSKSPSPLLSKLLHSSKNISR